MGFPGAVLIKFVVDPSEIRGSSKLSSELEAPAPAHVAVRHSLHMMAAHRYSDGKALRKKIVRFLPCSIFLGFDSMKLLMYLIQTNPEELLN